MRYHLLAMSSTDTYEASSQSLNDYVHETLLIFCSNQHGLDRNRSSSYVGSDKDQELRENLEHVQVSRRGYKLLD